MIERRKINRSSKVLLALGDDEPEYLRDYISGSFNTAHDILYYRSNGYSLDKAQRAAGFIAWLAKKLEA